MHMRKCLLISILGLLNVKAFGQGTPTQQEIAVGASVNYVFATELGSGIYEFDGRTLQIYRMTYTKDWREADEDALGIRFVVPFTFGFFDFEPLDVLSKGIPTRVDSFSVVPGVEFDYLLPDDWHLIPFVRAGASFTSRSVDGWLYGAGVRAERRSDWHGWDSFARSEVVAAGVGYRQDIPNDEFERIRQGINLARGIGWQIRGREVEFGIYGIVDVILDPPTAPVADARKVPLQAEFGITFSTRPAFKLWRWDAPRIGFGYRLAGEMSSWHILIGAPF